MSGPRKRGGFGSVGLAVVLAALTLTMAAADPLPSWNDGPAKQAIVAFVGKVTNEGSRDFVPAPERIATFDNDGTLWSEQPMYFQFFFAVDRVKALAPQHPEWKTTEPFKSVLTGDMKSALATGEGALKIIAATHTGMTSVEFEAIVKTVGQTARHPKTPAPVHGNGLPADAGTARVPARERLQDLHRFRWRYRLHAPLGRTRLRHSARAGRRQPGELRFELRDDTPVLVRERNVAFIDDGPGKPVGIQRNIGRRPIFAFGNSDGDQQMLEWTVAGGRCAIRRALYGTPMHSASGPTIASPASAISIKRSTRRRPGAGASWT